jgi:hypothetical protein
MSGACPIPGPLYGSGNMPDPALPWADVASARLVLAAPDPWAKRASISPMTGIGEMV